MKKTISIIIVLAAVSFYINVSAQTQEPELTAAILHVDSAFWNAYNNCDTAAFKKFFTNDIEFYHDKGGITTGANMFTEALNKNLCSNNNYRLRREAVAETVQVYPMKNNNQLYGAIITGEHLFYITENSKPEYLDGDANFTHLWLLKDGEWKMARILSYNHYAATYVNKRKEVTLNANRLKKLTGIYTNSHADTMFIGQTNNSLILHAGNNSYTLYPQSETAFYTKERDLLFEFMVNEKDNSITVTIKEKGAKVDELNLQKH